MKEPGEKATRAIVAAVQLSSVSDAEFEASLTASETLVAGKLFATLDTTVRGPRSLVRVAGAG